MALVAAETERDGAGHRRPADWTTTAASPSESVVQAACQLAARENVAVIVTLTRTGETACFAARWRPVQPILAFTHRTSTYRWLALVHGVVPRLLGEDADAHAGGDSLERARQMAREDGWAGQRAVVVAHDRIWIGAL